MYLYIYVYTNQHILFCYKPNTNDYVKIVDNIIMSVKKTYIKRIYLKEILIGAFFSVVLYIYIEWRNQKGGGSRV